MELLIAVLIALGVVTTKDSSSLDQKSIDKIIQQNNITQKQIDDQAQIIGLEESDV